jgi:aspartate-semialdehyde dehydrogenase
MSAHFARAQRDAGLDRLSDRRLLRELAYVGGQWTAGAAGTFEVRDPANGETVAWVAALDAGQADAAIDAAAAALPGWRARLPQERAAVLRRWCELILAAREDLALLMTLEQGKPLVEACGEIDYAASFVEWYAEEGKRLNAESVTSHLPDAEMLGVASPSGWSGW